MVGTPLEGEHLHPYTLDPTLEDKYHGKEQIYTRAKDPDCTGIDQNQHKHGRTVLQAQRSPAVDLGTLAYQRSVDIPPHIADTGICRRLPVYVGWAFLAGSFVLACRFFAFCFTFFLAGLCADPSCICRSGGLFCVVPFKCKCIYLTDCIGKQFLQFANLLIHLAF